MSIARVCLFALLGGRLFAGIQEPLQVDGGQITGTPGWGWGIREYLGIPFAAPRSETCAGARHCP